jgi:hypothetical protein
MTRSDQSQAYLIGAVLLYGEIYTPVTQDSRISCSYLSGTDTSSHSVDGDESRLHQALYRLAGVKQACQS